MPSVQRFPAGGGAGGIFHSDKYAVMPDIQNLYLTDGDFRIMIVCQSVTERETKMRGQDDDGFFRII